MPAPLMLDVGPARLSGLLAEPAGAVRGLLVALHGGGARAAYFDSPVDPACSLIRLGAAAGWRAAALDRPGYGISAPLAASRLRAAEQVELIACAVAQLRPAGLPVVLVGHSLGAIVAVHAAATDAVPGLVALAIGGIPLRYTAAQTERLSAIGTSEDHIRRPGEQEVDPADWFGPSGSWDPRLLAHRRDLVTRTPSGEFLDARDCPELLPPVLGQVRYAVQVAAAEHELTSAGPRDVLDAARAALMRAPVVETLLVQGSGHNLSLGHAAPGYHLRVLAFAEHASERQSL